MSIKLAGVAGIVEEHLPAKLLGERELEVTEAVSRSERDSLSWWLLPSLSGIFRAASLHSSSPFASMLICTKPTGSACATSWQGNC